MTKRKLSLFLFALLITCLVIPLPTAQSAGGYVVVVGADHKTDSISKGDLAKIFFKRSNKWPDGSRAQPVDQKVSSGARKAFSKSVMGRSASMVHTFWQQQIFSGKGEPPPSKGSDGSVMSFVSNRKGGVGYVSAGADTSKVKVLQIN
ncbi:MAG: hypothetical protein V3V08_13005 [Nannocystaceae bacterium]